MARSGKDINIPLGPQKQSEDIREALIRKVKEQEQIANSQTIHEQEETFARPETQVNPVQYNNQANSQPYVSASNKQYSGYGTYSSPFNNNPQTSNPTMRTSSNLIEAIHANEPVKYKPKKRKSAVKTFLVLILMIAFIFGLSWALREFVFQAYEIPSGSMEKTIMTGDMVFAEKISPKVTTPKKGDIVTFDDPLNSGRILIKRVVATGGQTVDIKNNKLYIDGVEQNESYVNGLPTTQIRSSKITYPYVVPEDSIWLMGDNRTNSQDSRYFGAVPTSSVIGHGLFIY